MLVLLLFCVCSANFVQSLEDSGIIVVPAEGNTLLSCNLFSKKIIPLKVKILVKENTYHSWITLELNSIFVELDTIKQSLSLPAEVRRNTSGGCSCSAENDTQQVKWGRETELNNVTFDPGKAEPISCNTSKKWTTLRWSQQGHLLAMVTRGETKINVRVVKKGPLSVSITSIISSSSQSVARTREKTALLSCKTATGFQKFMEEKYWIIVVSALGYVLFCSSLACGYITFRRRRKAEKEKKAKARFFKVSTARNLYMESINQEPANPKQDGMYQNFSPTKDRSSDRFSNKSSFLDPSEDGDSYLEPMALEEVDQISDDGVCYENATEEIKEGSIGSESYEDMNGPKNEQILTPQKTCEEDADSYENMQTPIYSQMNRSTNSLCHVVEDGDGQSGKDMVDVSTEQQWPTSIELMEQNGDFYLSYQSNNF